MKNIPGPGPKELKEVTKLYDVFENAMLCGTYDLMSVPVKKFKPGYIVGGCKQSTMQVMLE